MVKRLHTLMSFLAVLSTDFNVEATNVEQALNYDPNAQAERPGAHPTTYESYEGDAACKAALGKALKPVELSDMFGKDGYMGGPGGNVTPVTINGVI